MVINGRTDLASEASRRWRQQAGDTTRLPGVLARQEQLQGLNVTAVQILDERGEAALRKAPGQYYTLELPRRCERGAEEFPRAVGAAAELLHRCLGKLSPQSVLIAALGNPDITPDAIGPLAASQILVTRHLKQMDPSAFADYTDTVMLRTGVLGTTGIESAVQIQSLCQTVRPSCVIAIDALAGADLEGLCRSLQICDTGIAPGSGVGNDRDALTRESLGVPVIAVGVPTVVDAAGFSSDGALGGMFVTPRNIDSAVRSASRVIAYGINLALHPTLQLADLDMLLG